MTLADRARRAVVLGLTSVPAPVRRPVFGAPAERDGVTLHPDMHLLMALRGTDTPQSLTRMRRRWRADAPLVSGRQPIGAVTDREITGPGGTLTLRFYTPRGLTGRSPALVYLHGGGFAIGDLDTHDALCRVLAEQSMVRVVAVGYRLAPESPFPAAVDDAVAAWLWVVEHAAGLGIDPDRVAIGGDSAGGNLAAVVTQEMVHCAGPTPRFQLLIYPVTDFSEVAPSRSLFADGFLLTEAMIEQFDDAYLPGAVDRTDPRLSPLRGDLDGLPPAAVITAGFDPLRDEGQAYAAALDAAGVRVEAWCEDDLMHGFANLVGFGTAAPAAVRRISDALIRGVL